MNKEIKYKEVKGYFDKIDGEIFYNNRDDFKLKFSKLEDGRYFYSVNKVYNKRSLKQNNAMWGIPYMYFERALIESGNYQNPSNDTVHKFCMHHCLPDDYKERIKKEWEDISAMVDIKTGELFKDAFRLTTTKMGTKDSMNYYNNMQVFYAENFSSGGEDDFIPDPDPDYKNKNIKNQR